MNLMACLIEILLDITTVLEFDKFLMILIFLLNPMTLLIILKLLFLTNLYYLSSLSIVYYILLLPILILYSLTHYNLEHIFILLIRYQKILAFKPRLNLRFSNLILSLLIFHYFYYET